MVGIVGYGTQIPRYRIKVEEIAKVWGADAPSYKRGLNLNEKSVPAPDEDCATLSVNAARNALIRAGIDPQEIGAVYVGSESRGFAYHMNLVFVILPPILKSIVIFPIT